MGLRQRRADAVLKDMNKRLLMSSGLGDNDDAVGESSAAGAWLSAEELKPLSSDCAILESMVVWLSISDRVYLYPTLTAPTTKSWNLSQCRASTAAPIRS